MGVIGALYRPEGAATGERVDRGGAALLLLWSTLLLLGLSVEGASRWWLLLGGGASLWFFLWRQGRVEAPLIPVALLRLSLVRRASLLGFLSGGALYALVAFIPMAVQGIQRSSPLRAGFILTSISMGWVSSSLISGRIFERVGARRMMAVSGLSLALGGLLLLGLSEETSTLRLVVGMASVGVGMGTGSLSMIVSIQREAPWSLRALATSTVPFCRSMGGAVGVALAGAMLTQGLRASGDALGEPGIVDATRLLLDPARREGLSEGTRELLARSLAEALAPALWMVLVASLIYAAVALRWPRLRGGVDDP